MSDPVVIIEKLSSDKSLHMFENKSNGESWTATNICFECNSKDCPCRDDSYNTNGDCLWEK
jgi:hypothetical protein